MSAFNWRDYIAISDDTYYVDSFGNPTPALMRNNAERQQFLLAKHFRNRENQKLVEQTLDQMSLIPEVQEEIRQAHAVFAETCKNDPELAQESGGKIRISVESGRMEYNAGTGIVKIDSTAFERHQYISRDGARDYSLQRVLAHELRHAGDPTLGADKDFAQSKAAMAEAIQGVFQYYPELRAEYAEHGTVMGRPVGKLLQAKNMDEFNAIYRNDVLQGMAIYHPLNLLREFVSEMRTHPEYGVFGILDFVYEASHDRIMIEQDEMPVIGQTNPIIGTYYGEPPRINYDSRERPNAPHRGLDYNILQPSLAPFTHPDIAVPPERLAPTAKCYRQELLAACPDRHINGVSYGQGVQPSAQTAAPASGGAPKSAPLAQPLSR